MKATKARRLLSLFLVLALTMSFSIQVSFAEGGGTEKISLKVCSITLEPGSYYYDNSGSEYKPGVTVKYGGTTYDLNKDYTVEYDENTVPGQGQVLIKATDGGSLTGWKVKLFNIYNTNIADQTIKLSATSYTYKCKIDEYETVPAVQKPTVTITGKDGTTLKKDVDYTVSYSNKNSKNAGTYSVTIKGINDYSGEVKKTYTIKPMSIKGSDFQAVTSRDYVYTGKYIKPAASVYLSKDIGNDFLWKKLVKGTDYTVVSGPTYSRNKNMGYAQIKIKVKGKGNYTGTATLYGGFSIGPKQVKITSLKSGKNKITLKWTKSSNATGYIIHYYGYKGSKDTPYKTTYVTKNSTLSKTITKLKSGYTYWVDVQAYKNIKGDKVYAWKDNSKSIRVK